MSTKLIFVFGVDNLPLGWIISASWLVLCLGCLLIRISESLLWFLGLNDSSDMLSVKLFTDFKSTPLGGVTGKGMYNDLLFSLFKSALCIFMSRLAFPLL